MPGLILGVVTMDKVTIQKQKMHSNMPRALVGRDGCSGIRFSQFKHITNSESTKKHSISSRRDSLEIKNLQNFTMRRQSLIKVWDSRIKREVRYRWLFNMLPSFLQRLNC